MEKVYFKKYFRNIVVPFETLLDNQHYAIHREFILSLSSKKAYYKLIEFIIEENNRLLSLDDDIAIVFIYNYYCIKKKIDCNGYESENHREFIEDVLTNIFNNDLVELIKKYVKKRKTYSIDHNINLSNHKYDLGTTFMDVHYEILYCISVMSRLIIPLITNYIFVKSLGKESDDLIMEFFIELFTLMESFYEGHNTYNKLYTFIERNIMKKHQNDTKIWSDLKLFGKTVEYVIEDIVKKLLTNTIPKFEFDKNIISLIVIVIRHSIGTYIIRGKFPYIITPLKELEGINDSDNNVVTQVELANSYTNKRDEEVIFLRDYFVQDTIDIIKRRNNIVINDDEIDFYTNSIVTHRFQETAVVSAFNSYFSGTENIYGSCNSRNYAELVAILSKIFDNVGIQCLIKYLTGIRVSYKAKSIPKSYHNIIKEDDRYKNILETKFRYTGTIISKKDPITATIISLINNYYIYNEFGNPMNGEKIIENDIKDIINGVLDFYQKIIL